MCDKSFWAAVGNSLCVEWPVQHSYWAHGIFIDCRQVPLHFHCVSPPLAAVAFESLHKRNTSCCVWWWLLEVTGHYHLWSSCQRWQVGRFWIVCDRVRPRSSQCQGKVAALSWTWTCRGEPLLSSSEMWENTLLLARLLITGAEVSSGRIWTEFCTWHLLQTLD